MSAVRRNNTRAKARSRASLPYARLPVKKSTWSWAGWLNYINPFNPLRFRSSKPEEKLSESSEDDSQSDGPSHISEAAQTLSVRGHQLEGNGMPSQPNGNPIHSLRPPPSRIPPSSKPPVSTSFPIPSSTTSAENLEIVRNFLAEKQISTVEAEGVITLIQNSTPADKPPPFRFSQTPSTPSRGNSPLLANESENPFGVSAQTTKRKMLSKNPNGSYRWEGGGSAKTNRSRNRYYTPAFGHPPTPERITLKGNKETTRTDAKRRRVGADQEVISNGPPPNVTNGHGIHRASAPEPTPGRVNYALSFSQIIPKSPTTPTPKSNGITNSSRLRVNVPPKPTTPVIPSPLRNAWCDDSSPEGKQPSPPTRQTKTANFMEELIKEATPPKKPDVSNPYQAASPVGKVSRPKRPRVARKAEPPKKKDSPLLEKTPEKEFSPQDIVEATLPKGSKRSRPPTHLEQPSNLGTVTPSDSPPSLRSHFREKARESDNGNEEGERSVKRAKPGLDGLGRSPLAGKAAKPVVNGKVDAMANQDAEMSEPILPPTERQKSPPPTLPANASFSTSPTLSTSPSSLGAPINRPAFSGFKPTTPKEPSKLRFSYKPENPSTGTTATATTTIPPPPSLSAFPQVVPTSPSLPSPEEPKVNVDPKSKALSKPVTALPTFVFPSPPVNLLPPDHLLAINKVKALPTSSLPVFDFTKAATEEPTKPFPFASTSSATSTTHPQSSKPVSSAPTQGFNWAAAGLKPPTKPVGGDWECSQCMLSNPATAVEKCAICDAPRPSTSPSTTSNVTTNPAKPIETPPAPAPVKSFDWGAAGMKPTPASGTWTCSVCLLSNPASAVEQCSVCDTPR